MFTIFINKTEVAGTTTLTQYLSSHDPTEKSNIYRSNFSMSSSEDASIGHGGDFY